MVEQRITQGHTEPIIWFNLPSQDVRFLQEKNSTLQLHLIQLPTQDFTTPIRHLVEVQQLGEGCTTEIYCLSFLRHHQEMALTTRLLHQVGKGSSKQIIKYVLDDEAKGEFFGELTISPQAQRVDAQQTNRNILLSRHATMRTRPQLEIYADDVKASHGATTGQLDESSLFYMQQRCISPEEGRKILIRAFMEDIVDSVADAEKRDLLIDAINRVV